MYEIDIRKCLASFAEESIIRLSVPPAGVDGDLSTNLAMVSQLPQAEIIASLEKLDVIEWAKRVGPGFINMKVTADAMKKEIKEILADPEGYGGSQKEGSVIFEMVSSNPTGPLHIGHGRGAAIGDTLARIYSRLGIDVYREYYVNDAGRQMELLGQSIFNSIKGEEIPENGYKGDYIADIGQKLKGICSSVEECSQKAGAMILNDHIRVLNKFAVEYDNFFSEKEMITAGKVKEKIEEIKQKGLTYNKEGALWFRSTDFGDDLDRVLIKAGGELTYFASDCAYHSDKVSRFPGLVNIWGADHHGYVPRMNAFWDAMEYTGSLDILLYQLVNLKRGTEKIAMSTRQ
ncbi:MAG: arginine--tRNA ligase, partial [Elusimicrobiota bacterium]